MAGWEIGVMLPVMRILLPLLASVAVSAIDLFDFADLRVSGAVLTPNSEISSNNVKSEWDRGHRLGADLLLGTDLLLVGVAYGVGVAVDERTADGAEQRTTTAHVQAGPYLGLGPVQVELLGMAGAGTSTLDLRGNTDDASVSEYGANLNLVLGLSHLAVGVGAGWITASSDHRIQGIGDIDSSGGDWTTGAFVGWRF